MKKLNLIFLILWAFFAQNMVAQPVDFLADSVCLGDFTSFSALTDLTDTISGYYWDFNNDGIYLDAFGKDVKHTFSDTGMVPVSLRIETSDSMYTLPSPKQVLVYPVPVANFNVDNLCEGQTAWLTDQSSVSKGTITKYYWDFNNDGTFDDISGPSVQFNYGNAGKYSTMLKVVSDKNCSHFTTKSIIVNPLPNADFNIQGLCANELTQFVNNSTITSGNIDLFIWDFGDGSGDATSGNAAHIYHQTGNYSASVIAVAGYCRDTLSGIQLAINPQPSLVLECSDTILKEGKEIVIIAKGEYSNILWSTNENTDSIIVSDTGIYSVQVSNNSGCINNASVKIINSIINTDSTEITVKSKILTPNGDIYNQYFEIDNINSYNNCHLTVYTIYGDIVYESKDYNNDWDGNNSNLDPGTYFYIIKIGSKTKKGTVNILK